MASERTSNAKSTSKASLYEGGEEGVCELCYHDTRDWAVGECDHPTCIRCLTERVPSVPVHPQKGLCIKFFVYSTPFVKIVVAVDIN